MPVCGEQRAGRPTTEGETMTTEPRTPEEIEAALKDNAGHMHDAWLDAYNLLAKLAPAIGPRGMVGPGGMVYVSTTTRIKIARALDAGAVAMARNDDLEDQLTALQNEESN